ncbi:MAG TPA: TetR/AcrR family transcriptional regulator [Pseudolysinimonas sp.]|nr:TetR/AcrR family transcriptional regulator [Pseudolysinimonas sp.]
MINVRPDGFVVLGRERAKPLAPDERRAAIIDAVIPLIREHGRAVSTRQLADAAGVAEGTLFRAFGDKDSIIQAATDRFLDPEPLRAALRGIDPDEPTEAKVRQVLQLLRARFEGVVGFMSAIGQQGPPPGVRSARPSDGDWMALLDRVFREDELAVPIATLGFYIRLLAFGSAIPVFSQAKPFSNDELADLILHGVIPLENRKKS